MRPSSPWKSGLAAPITSLALVGVFALYARMEMHVSSIVRAESYQITRDENVRSVGWESEQADPPSGFIDHEIPLRLPAIEPRELKILQELPPVCIASLPGLGPKGGPPALPFHGFMNEPVQQESSFEPQPLTRPSATRSHKGRGTENETPYNPHARATAVAAMAKKEAGELDPNAPDPHAEAFSKSCFPSASECKKCHEQIYDEWAVSSHANAALSPMFHKFEQKVNDLTQGTIGYFCMRCHAPVAVAENMPRDNPIWNGPRVHREGVTCVACHRVAEQFGKTNGERRMEPGPLEAPTYGAGDGGGLAEVLRNKAVYKVKTDPNDPTPGQVIHNRVIRFEQISQSTFCMSCHQVAVPPDIKLEVVWEQYRASPAAKNGIRCQDCHMGSVPGVAGEFATAHVAIINDKKVGTPRRHSNHVFFGPGGSISHPGLFPQNPASDRWTFNQWLLFDWRSGWGTQEFEDRVESGEITATFPPEWAEVDDRLDARDVINANQKRLRVKDDFRRQVMENGSRVEGPFFARGTQYADGALQAGRDLSFHYIVKNTNPGHNMPSGSLGAQPQIWLNVALVGPGGRRVWESGYLDTVGDLADIHSADALTGRVPFDRQLFNLQTKFLVTNVKGTDREFPLPVNFDIDQLPFIRPGPQPVTVMNHPPFIRMEAHSIPPLGSRTAPYKVPGELLRTPGQYRLTVRLRHRIEPIYFMKFVESTPEMIRSMNEKILDFHPYSFSFEVR